MHQIPSGEVTPAFAACWRAAGMHLRNQGQGPLSWIKADLDGPFLEHLSFRMGNQLFYVRVVGDDGRVVGPSGIKGLMAIAEGCAGVPCLMPMQLHRGEWETAEGGWGLVHAVSGEAVVPPALVTDAKIVMTDWEVHDFAVQVVRDQLRKDGRRVTSCQGNPHVDPSVWLDGEAGPEWVVVRAGRHPAGLPDLPLNIKAIADYCAPISKRGHFAPVVVANADDPFAPDGAGALPLWRGYGMLVRFNGLVPV